MFRELILTVVLTALYAGELSHLGGSLLIIFCFLFGHLLLRPYLNQVFGDWTEFADGTVGQSSW